MYATIFGNVANIIQRINQQESELVRRETELVDFMHVNKFPESLRNRMEDYFYNYWYTTRGVEAHEVQDPNMDMTNIPQLLGFHFFSIALESS